MSTFGSLLVQDQIVDVVEIERALQRQVIYGGDLATNLLELRLVDEALLTEYAARSFGLSVLPRELIENPALEAIKAIPWELVDIHRILPVKIEGHRILLAVSSPVTGRAQQEISHVVGLEPNPQFILDFRLDMALNRFFGISLSPRLKVLQERFAPEFKPGQPPLIPRPRTGGVEVESAAGNGDDETSRIYTLSRPQEPMPDSKVSEITLLKVPRKITGDGGKGPKTSANKSRGISSDAIAKPDSTRKSSPGLTARNTPLTSLTEGESVQGPMPDLEEFKQRIDGLETRDDIIDTAIGYLSQVFDFVILFVVGKETIKARTAVARHERISRLNDTEISLADEGIFKTVFETKSFHLGPLSTSERDQVVLEKIGRPWPKSCAVFPILLRQRVVLMVWGDSGGLGVRVDQGYELVRFANIISDALERLVLVKKLGTADKIPKPGPLGSLKRAISSAPPRAAGSTKPPREPVSLKPSGEVVSSTPIPAASSVEDSKEDMDAGASGPRDSMSEWAGRYHLRGDEKGKDEKRVAVDRVPGVVKNRISAIPRRHRESEPTKPYRPTDSTGLGPNKKEKVDRSRLVERIDERSLESQPGDDATGGVSDEIRRTADYGDSPVMIKDVVAAVAMQAAREREAADSAKPEEPSSKDGDGQPLPSVEASKPPRSVMVEMKEEVERLVERILAPGRFDETAADLLLGIGDDALRTLIEKFPGPLTCDRYQEAGRLRRVGQHGPLMRMLLKFGQKAVPHLLPLFESRDSDVRFYATFMFSELNFPEALSKLVTRLFDSDRQIRAITLDILKGFSQYPEYRWAMRDIVDALTVSKSTLEAKRIGADALGALGERSAVPGLAELLDSADNQLKELSRQSLVKITFDDLGYSSQRWKDWWEKHKEQHRIEWAIASITHPKEHIRNAAKKELRQLTGEVVEGFNKPMDHNQRLEFQRKLIKWWAQEGQALYPLWEG